MQPLDFVPANAVEEDLFTAATTGNTDNFLSTLLLAKVLVPGDSADPEQWPTEQMDAEPHLLTFTSTQRLTEHLGPQARSTTVPFLWLIQRWPDERIGFAVNPGTPVGATLTGAEVKTLANWAAEVGLTAEAEPAAPAAPSPEAATRASAETAAPAPTAGPTTGEEPSAPDQLVMQKTIPAEQLPYYLERGYDRVCGFVHRASEVAHLRTPEQLYHALGLGFSGSRFRPDQPVVYVLRWLAHCPRLYRIPFGGPNEEAMHAMRGWVLERPPFRGNGFAASETGDVIAEFKVDTVRLPHGAQLWRIDRDGHERLVAVLDADGPNWQRVGEP